MVRLIAQNSAANTPVVRLRKLPAPAEPNTVAEAPEPNASKPPSASRSA